MPINLVLPQPGDRIYCPYHKKWESMGPVDDATLCDWCCQKKVPDGCPMHGMGELPGEEGWPPHEGMEWDEALEEWIVPKSRPPVKPVAKKIRAPQEEREWKAVELVIQDADDFIDLT